MGHAGRNKRSESETHDHSLIFSAVSKNLFLSFFLLIIRGGSWMPFLMPRPKEKDMQLTVYVDGKPVEVKNIVNADLKHIEVEYPDGRREKIPIKRISLISYNKKDMRARNLNVI